jgi:predicted MPP superfamily phosphohydrolase
MFFSPVVFLVYAGICFYIGRRLFTFIHFFLPGIKNVFFWPFFALLCCILVFGNFFNQNLTIIRTAGMYWMAVFLYMFALLLLSDFIRIVLFLAGKKIPNFNIYVTGAAIFFCMVIIVFGVLHARSIKTVNYEMTLRGEGDGMRIALISDLHIGYTVGSKWIGRVVDAVNMAQADIILISGDVFDRYTDAAFKLPDIIKELKRLDSPLGVYACLGNHDVDRMSLSGGSTGSIEEFLKEAGIVLLQDEVRSVRDNLYIAGRRDARPIGADAARKTPEELLADIDGTVIVLDHQPTEFPLLEKAGANLTLSGHTHRGQVFPGSIVTYFLYKNMGASHYGYWKGDHMQAVITSGTGIWGPPLRVATDSEVAVIDIKFVQ